MLDGLVTDERNRDAADSLGPVLAAWPRVSCASGRSPSRPQPRPEALRDPCIVPSPRMTDCGLRHAAEVDVDKLMNALEILSETEKQLKTTKNQSTWLTAALLDCFLFDILWKTQGSNQTS